jgi:hypothetical protein
MSPDRREQKLPVRNTVRREDDQAAAVSEQALPSSGLPVATMRPTMFLASALNREVTSCDIPTGIGNGSVSTARVGPFF